MKSKKDKSKDNPYSNFLSQLDINLEPIVLKSKISEILKTTPNFFAEIISEIKAILKQANENIKDISNDNTLNYLNKLTICYQYLYHFIPNPGTSIPSSHSEIIISLIIELFKKLKKEKLKVKEITIIISDLFKYAYQNYPSEIKMLLIYHPKPEEFFNVISYIPQFRQFLYSFYENTMNDKTDEKVAEFNKNIKKLIEIFEFSFFVLYFRLIGEQDKEKILKMYLDELITIAKVYRSNFSLILIEFRQIVNKLHKIKKENFEYFFPELAKLIFNDNIYYIELCEGYIDLMREEIDNLELKRNKIDIIMKSLFHVIDIDKYKWIIFKSSFLNNFIEKFIRIPNITVIDLYFDKLLAFCEIKNEQNEFVYIPKYEMKSLIKCLIDFSEEMGIFEKVIDNILKLIKLNPKIIDIIVNECNFSKIERTLISKKSNLDLNLQRKCLSLTRNILEYSERKFQINFQIEQDDFAYDIGIERNLIVLEFENNEDMFNQKLAVCVQNLLCILNSMNIETFLTMSKAIFKILYQKDPKLVNSSGREALVVFIQTNEFYVNDLVNKGNVKGIKDFVQMLFDYIISSNNRWIKYKFTKDKKYNTVLVPLDDAQIIKLLSKIAVSNNNIIRDDFNKMFKEYFFDSKNNLILSIYMYWIICNCVVQENFALGIKEMFIYIYDIWEKNDDNIKPFLQFDIVSLLLHVIQKNSLNNSEESKELMEITYAIFAKISKYFTKIQLGTLYLRSFVLLKLDVNYYNEIQKLFNIIYDNINLSQRENYNKITLCNKELISPYSFNMLYMSGLFYNQTIGNKLSILMSIEFKSIDILSNFTLMGLNNEDYSIDLVLKDRNTLIVNENSNCIYTNSKMQMVFEMNKKYEIIIELNIENKEIILFVDRKSITNIKLKVCRLDIFNIMSGWQGNIIQSRNSYEGKIAFVDYYYILIFNSNIIDDELLLKELNDFKVELCKCKRLRDYTLVPKAIKEKIISEISFDNINLINSLKVNNNNLLEHIYHYTLTSTYLPFAISFNENNPQNKKSCLYLLSKFDNFQSFLSLNSIIQLDKIHKENIVNSLFIDYGLDKAINDTYCVDFLCWFIFEEFTELRAQIFQFAFKMLTILNHSTQEYFVLNYLTHIKILFCLMNKEKEYEKIINVIYNYLFINQKSGYILINFYTYVLLDNFLFERFSLTLRLFIINSLKDKIIKYPLIDIKSLFKIGKSLFNIIFYVDLKKQSIITLIKEIVEYLLDKVYNSHNTEYKEILYSYAIKSINITNYYNQLAETHLKVPNILSNKNILAQIDDLSKTVYSFYSIRDKNFMNKEKKITIKDLKDNCPYCIILLDEFENIMNFLREMKSYEKIKEKMFHDYLLIMRNLESLLEGRKNKDNNSDIEYENKKYVFYLSSKETRSRMKNKFKYKLNDTISNPDKTFTFLFVKAYYKKFWDILSEAIQFDKISHRPFIEVLAERNTIQKVYNCLLLKKMRTTTSITIITKNYIYIYTNLVIGRLNQLYINNRDFSNSFWVKDEYITEWDELYSDKAKQGTFNFSESLKKNTFYYKNYKFSFKRISYNNISELFKRPHLNIDNSIEIFCKNGDSYLLVFNKNKRDEVFNCIIDNICKTYPEQKDGILNNPLIREKNCNSIFYMRYSPLKNTRSKYIKYHSNKSILDAQTLIKKSMFLWANNQISNFDYILLLNTLSGRSYNDMSQYFIFPWIIKDILNEQIDITSEKFYRDLTYPPFAQSQSLRNSLEAKYELNDDIEEDIYHSGTFYSTHGFVVYFMIRQRPFSEMGLDIQMGRFDTSDRLFYNTNCFNGTKNKYHEHIPELFYLPEIFINTNKFDFGQTQKREIVDDVNLPKWCQNDPRFFVLFHMKMLESKIVSEGLNNWIDMVFGYKQDREKGKEILATYRRAVLPFTEAELKEKEKTKELNSLLFEISELGVAACNLFKEEHIKKQKCQWFRNNNIYFNNCTIRKIEEKILYSKRIGDCKWISKENEYVPHLGGIASLCSVMNSTAKELDDKENRENISKYVFVGKNCLILGRKMKQFVYFKDNIIHIVFPKYELIYEYYLNEDAIISSIAVNSKGNVIIVGFTNGNIIKYKINYKDNEYFLIENKKCLFRKEYSNSSKNIKLDEELKKYNNFLSPEISFANLFNYEYSSVIIPSMVEPCERKKRKSPKRKKSPKKHKIFYLIKTKHIINIILSKVTHIVLNEYFSALICSDTFNKIYIYNLGDFTLLNCADYLTLFSIPIKTLYPIAQTGEFLVSTSLTVHLFSINGVPLAQLSLIEKINQYIPPITSIDAIYQNDVLLYTGHKKGLISIWRIRNKDTITEFRFRKSYLTNQPNSQFFLDEFKYQYKSQNVKKHEDYELRRKFDLSNQIKLNELTQSILFVRVVTELSSLIVVDRNKDVYLITCQKQSEEDLNKNNEQDIFSQYDEIICVGCKKKKKNESEGEVDYESRECLRGSDLEKKREINFTENTEFICNECIQKLSNPIYVLYI